MSFISILFTAVALAMDAFAVALTLGMKENQNKIKTGLKVGAYFGIFQGLMPLIGWFLGVKFADYVIKFNHWIAFILLFVIGGRMIYEALDDKEEEVKKDLTIKVMLLLAIATSIDALAVGVSFAFLKVNILLAVFLIGIITFSISFVGVLIGNKLADLLQKKAEVLGGLILIFIGIKILFENINFIDYIKTLF